MKAFLVVLALLLAGVVGLGFYQGWFRVSTGGTDHQGSVTVTVDQEKIKEDKEKVRQLGHGPKAKTSGEETSPEPRHDER